ncbi:hypothetical protein VTJ83DRAFT_3588 [Remersonia thermophila]|uniref:PHD-type domain-containing protein n=1 Tax=Remersonia thermophila TaxID=72144 RepID=A0ABR4DGL7_9PEZI
MLLPRCWQCKEPETPDKPLVSCVRCGGCYHPVCHRPYPTASVDWVCKPCLAGQGGRLGLYHEKLPWMTRAASHTSPLSSRPLSEASAGGRFSSKPGDGGTTGTTSAADASPAARNMSASVSLTHPQTLGSPGATMKCSYPGCATMVEKHQVLCDIHLGVTTHNASRQALAQAHRVLPVLAPAPANGLNAARPNPAFAKPGNHMPPPMETTPNFRRKTAAPALRAKPQPPTPRAGTSASRDDCTSSRSPPPPVSRLSVHSPPPSPRPADEEPPQKRLRRSSTPELSSKTRLNGMRVGQQTVAKPVLDESHIQPENPPSDQRHPEQRSSPRSGKQRVKEGKAAPRQSSSAFMRRLPLNLANLRFIDEPPAVSPRGSVVKVNGTADTSRRPSSGSSEISSISGFENGFFESSVCAPQTSSVRAGPAGSSDPSRKPATRPSEHHPAPPPERGRVPSTQNCHGPFQSSFSSSHAPMPPQNLHLSIRPLPLAETWKSRIPKPKEVDTALFDALIYSQSDAASPPPDVDTTAARSPASRAMQLKDEPLYLNIDPRIHWPQRHSQAWHAAKQEEIKARGKRKANFGRAAQSLQKQRKQQSDGSFEETLPEKIRENPAWLKMVTRLMGPPAKSSSSVRSGSSRSSLSAVDGEVATWASRVVNGGGAEAGQGLLHKKTGKKSARVTARRMDNTGVVVISGLNLAFVSSLKQ